MFTLRHLASFVFVITVLGVSSDNQRRKCPSIVDDGFFSQRYSPQRPNLMDVADKCMQINDCSAAKDSPYREYNEACNNLKFPMWGVKNTAIVRLLGAAFSDGISKLPKATDGSDSPNARTIRTTVLKNKIIKDKNISYLFSVFAQYISHDTARTSISGGNFAACCDPGNKWPAQLPTNCTSARIPDDDEFYKQFGVTCIPRLRPLVTDDFGCPLAPVQQIIEVTHFLDQSLIYGSSKEEAKKFKSGINGQLLVSEINNKIFPKSNDNPTGTCDIRQGDKPVCFDAGDPRLNQNPPFFALVTIFVRAHNHIALKLTKVNQRMPESQVFEEVRRILIAVEHMIITNEFMPLLVGSDFMAQAKLDHATTSYHDNYNELLNPSTLVEFMHGAYRSMHSTILDQLKLSLGGGKSQNLVINDFINRPGFAIDHFDPILKSICKSPMAIQDKHGANTMNNLFFRKTQEFGADLDVISIERGREAGFASYCVYMEQLLKEPEITSWEDLKRYMADDTIEDLKKVYKNVRDIDMYVGGSVECPIGKSLFGKLFTAIILDQFKRWLLGDRHSPNLKKGPGKFTEPQLKELNKINMAYLLCKYGDNLGTVPTRPFELSVCKNPDTPGGYVF